jgi:hypothetical protein
MRAKNRPLYPPRLAHDRLQEAMMQHFSAEEMIWWQLESESPPPAAKPADGFKRSPSTKILGGYEQDVGSPIASKSLEKFDLSSNLSGDTYHRLESLEMQVAEQAQKIAALTQLLRLFLTN